MKENKLSNTIQIEKIKKENIFLAIFAIIYSLLLMTISIYLIILEEPRELGICFLLSLPISIVFGAVIPIKENKKKIEKIIKDNNVSNK